MKRLSAPHLTATIVLLAAAANHARADYMNWTYTSASSVSAVAVNAQAPDGGATVQLTGFTNGSAAASIPALVYVTSAGSTNPITFDPSTEKYTMGLTFTDSTTNHSGTLTFNGTIGGILSATTSTLLNTLTAATSSLTLDGHVYTVSIPSVTLGSPSNPQTNILANVTVTNAPTTSPGDNPGGGPPGNPGGPGGPVSTPEPASLVLGGLGWSLLGIGCWWKRQRVALARAS